MADEIQYADGSYAGIRERDSLQVWRAGGFMSPAPTTTSSVAQVAAGGAASHGGAYFGGATLAFNVGSDTSTNDSGGGGGTLLSWNNGFGFDIIVTAHQLDVMTASASSCSASFGSSSNSTGTSTNMISSQQVNAIGCFNGGALSVKVKSGSYIVGGVTAGTSSALRARAYFTYEPAPAVNAG